MVILRDSTEYAKILGLKNFKPLSVVLLQPVKQHKRQISHISTFLYWQLFHRGMVPLENIYTVFQIQNEHTIHGWRLKRSLMYFVKYKDTKHFGHLILLFSSRQLNTESCHGI